MNKNFPSCIFPQLSLSSKEGMAISTVLFFNIKQTIYMYFSLHVVIQPSSVRC